MGVHAATRTPVYYNYEQLVKTRLPEAADIVAPLFSNGLDVCCDEKDYNIPSFFLVS